MPLEVPSASTSESPPTLSVDFLESDSVIDLLQASSNDDNMFSLSDDVPLFSTTGIPEAIVTPATTVDPKDIVRQDALIGSYFQSSLGNTNTDVTYVSQYSTPSVLADIPDDNVDDVFLAPITLEAATTSQYVFTKPEQPPPSRIKPVQRPNPRATNQFVINPFISKPIVKNLITKNRNMCVKTATRNFTTKEGSQPLDKPPARLSIIRNTTRVSGPSKPQSFILINRADGISSSRDDSLRSKLTHIRLTQSSDVISKCATASEAISTVGQNTSSCVVVSSNSFISKSKSISNYHQVQSHSQLTSQIAVRSKVSVKTTMAQSTLAVPLYPSPMIITRPNGEIATLTTSNVSNTTKAVAMTDTTKRSHTRFVIPVTMSPSEGLSIVTTSAFISNANTKPRVCAATPAGQGTAKTSALTSLTNTTSASPHRSFTVVPTRSTYTLHPGATLYAPTSTPSTKTSRLQTVPLTTTCKKFTIGSNDHTKSPDIAQSTTRESVPSKQNDSCKTALDLVRARSQFFIPIANSTGIGYLMTSTINTLPEVTQSNSAALASHISTIRPDASNRTRTRLILPLAHNVSGTIGSSASVDSNRARNTLAIISPRISSPADTSEISSIRAFAIAKPQNAILTQNLERASKPCNSTEPFTTADSDTSSLKGLLQSDMSSSAASTANPISRPLNRIYMPLIHNTSNTALAKSTSTNVSSCILSPSTYIFTSSIGALSANSTNSMPKTSQRVVIPLIHSSAVTSTNTITSTAGPSTDLPSSLMSTMDNSLKLRDRLTVPTVTATADNDISDSSAVATTSITAFTITKGRSNSVSVQSGISRSSESINTTSSKMFSANTAYISFATTSVPSTVMTHPQNTLSPSASSGDVANSSSLCLLTCATPTITTTGHRYVIKLAKSPSTSVTNTTVTSPITTKIRTISTPKTASPPESRTASQPRTFPGPRTYSIAQRNVAKFERTTHSRPVLNKRIVTAPALQIFPEIVSPQDASKLGTAATIHNQSVPRFTLSQSSGSSTLIVPQYKNTVFKNLSTIAHPLPSTARLPSPQTPTERLIIKRPVTCVAPRRSFANINATPQRTPITTVSLPSRMSLSEAISQLCSSDHTSQAPSHNIKNSLPLDASAKTLPLHEQSEEIINSK